MRARATAAFLARPTASGVAPTSKCVAGPFAEWPPAFARDEEEEEEEEEDGAFVFPRKLLPVPPLPKEELVGRLSSKRSCGSAPASP